MILRADTIKKKYGSRMVVKGISLQVEQGEIVGLLGPNGAGKTTSFYMIVGMVQPTEGHIYLDDEDHLKFLDIMQDSAELYGFTIHSYALMNTLSSFTSNSM